jgi:hypothetical protein
VKSFVGGIALAGLVGFFALVVRHSKVIALEDGARRMLRVNEYGKLRTGPDWRKLPDDGAEFINLEHPYAADLDVFGPGSFFQRLNVAHTQMGRRELSRFLTVQGSREEVLERQEAARALGPELELRQEMESLALGIERPRSFGRSTNAIRAVDLAPLLAWGKGSEARLRGGLWQSVARVFPVVTVSMMVWAALSDVTHLVWVAPTLVQVFIVLKFEPLARETFGIVSEGEGLLGRFAPLLERLERVELKARVLEHQKQRLVRDGRRPSVSMTRFARLVGWFELRQNGLVHPLIDSVLQGFVDQALSKFPEKITEYKNGKVGLLGMFVGEVMKLSKGKADPKLLNQLVKETLEK